jgi:hypothetical protein
MWTLDTKVLLQLKGVEKMVHKENPQIHFGGVVD